MTVLHHTVSGPTHAPTLAFLHGFLGSSSDWDEVSARLDESFRCIRIDLPGHGASTGLDDPGYTWDGALDRIALTLDAAGVDTCRLIGYSMGGRLALGFALRHPRRVRRLLLVGASPGLESLDAREDRIRLDAARAAAIRSDLQAFLEDWYRMPLFASLDARPHLRSQLIRSRSAGDPDQLARALEGFSTGRMPSYWPQLDAIGAPTLAMAGSGDPKFVEIAYRMAATGIPVSPLILPNCGHLIPLEHPSLLADSIRGYCRDGLLGAHRESLAAVAA